MPLSAEVYAASPINRCMQGYQRNPPEKVVVYARALQHWAEEINLPSGGGPCLLAEGMKELREEVKLYLSFSNEEVFWGVALPKKEEDQSPKTLSTNVPKASCVPESATKRRSLKFWGGKKFCIHTDQSWLLGRSPNHPRPQGQEWGQFSSPGLYQLSLQPLHQRLPPHQNPPHQYRHWQ